MRLVLVSNHEDTPLRNSQLSHKSCAINLGASSHFASQFIRHANLIMRSCTLVSAIL